VERGDHLIGKNWHDFIPAGTQETHHILMSKIRKGEIRDKETLSEIQALDGTRVSVKWFHSPANGDWILSIGFPYIDAKPTDTIESMRLLWAEHLGRDRTMIRALKHLTEAQKSGEAET
jgi:hypothetical protein